MNAVYVRVSTEEQAKTGYSLADQLATCRSQLTGMGLTDIKDYIDDGYSGEFLERPGLEQLRVDIRTGIIKNVMVYDPDRLSRNLVNQLLVADEIEKANANLMFVTGNFDCSPEGRLFFSIRGAISEFEKAKIRERTLRGKRQKALSGKLTHNDNPYGYNYDSEKSMYIINEKEAEVIRLIFDTYNSGMSGVRKIRSELIAGNILNRKGKPFTLSNISRILGSEMYAGTKWAFTTYDKTIGIKKKKHIKRDPADWIAVSVPPIVTREIWEKAQLTKKRNILISERNNNHDYLLRSIVKCSACGYAMIGVNNKSKGIDYFYYVCTAKAHMIKCPNRRYIPAQKLDDLAWNAVLNIVKNDGVINSPADNENKDRRINLEAYIAKLKAKQAALLKWVTDETITIEAAEPELQKISKELQIVQSTLNSLAMPKKKKISISLEDMLIAASFGDKRRAILDVGIIFHAERIKEKIELSIGL